ncbi:hypothetical protein OSTOST_04478 [Ostertagia ostertagi]
MVVVETQAGKRCAQLQYQLDTALIDLAGCQSQLVRSVPIEKYDKLVMRYKKECVAEVLGSELDEVARETVVSIAASTDSKTDELEAKNSYLKKIVEVLSEQNDFWSKETEILQNENEELKRFVEDMENESDLKYFRKARDAEESLAKGRREWAAERTRLIFSIRTLQTALSTAHLNSLNGLTLPQIEKLKAKIREVRENELAIDQTKSKIESIRNELEEQLVVQKSIRKARENVAEENGDVPKLERRLQTVYSSLELQTIASDRMKNTRKEKQVAEPVSNGESRREPTIEQLSSSREGSEASTTDSDGVTVKTILQDNSKEFEKQLAKMKEAAEICIQNYKKQLLQKEEALRIFRELAEEKLATSSRPIVEKEITWGASRKLNAKPTHKLKSRSVPVEKEKDTSKEKNESSRTPPEFDDFEANTEKKLEAERARYKNEIKQLQAKLRRMAANNKELLLTCEKIREDALAEIEAKAASRIKESDEQAVLKIRYDLEKLRKENKTLKKTVDEQKMALDSLKKTSDQGLKNPESEISKWNERKKIEESLSSVKRKLSSALEREKELQERLNKRDRVIADLRRDEEMRQKELDRSQRKLVQIQEEKDKLVRENSETVKLKSRLNEKVDELEKKAEEVSSLSIRLLSLQEEYSKLTRDYEKTRAELEYRMAVSQRVERSSKAIQVETATKAVKWAQTSNGQSTDITDRKVTQVEKIDRAVEVRGTARQDTSEMKVIVAMDDTLVFQLRETKKNMEKVRFIKFSSSNNTFLDPARITFQPPLK